MVIPFFDLTGVYEMTRIEHLEWCKKRAIEIIDSGDTTGGWTSFLSDMRKHPETENHSALPLGMLLFAADKLSTSAEMKKFVQDFN